MKQNLDKHDFHKYVTKKEGEGGLVEYIGDRYYETAKLSLSEIKNFIEAELFLLQKSGEIPKIHYQISIGIKGPESIEINLLEVDGAIFSKKFFATVGRSALRHQKVDPIFIKEHHRDIHSDLGFLLHFKLFQVLFRFNYERLIIQNEEIKEGKRRLVPSVAYSPKLVDEQTQSIRCKIFDKANYNPYVEAPNWVAMHLEELQC